MQLKRPIVGVVAAVAITTTMDATGLTMFSALPLFPLLVIFWYLDRFPRRSVGFVLGRWRDYGLATIYPVVVLGANSLVSVAAGAADLSQINWEKTWRNIAIVSGSTFVTVILTEEGFFRGWPRWAGRRKPDSCVGLQ